MSIINKIIDKLTLRIYRLEVIIQNRNIVINGYRNGTEFSVRNLLSSNSALTPLSNLCVISKEGKYSVSVENLESLKKFFTITQIDKYEFILSQEIQSISVEKSKEFKIQYVYNGTTTRIERILPLNTIIWDNNWILNNNVFYYLYVNNDFDFKQETIEGSNVLKFLEKDVVLNRHLIETELTISRENILKMKLSKISDNKIALNYNWSMVANEFNVVTGLDKYVIVGNTFYKTVIPSRLSSILNSESKEIIFEDDQIPNFIENIYPLIEEGVTDGSEVINDYQIYSRGLSAVLKVFVDEGNIIGKPYANIFIKYNRNFLNAYDISKSIGKDMKYVGVGKREWLSVDSLKRIGISIDGRQLDGTSLSEPFYLNASEVIYRGSERLEGICNSLVFDDLVWGNDNNSGELALNHLEFLCKYGISGGVICRSMNDYHFLKDFLSKIVYKAQTAKILIVAKKPDLEILSNQYSDFVPKIIETSKQSENYPKNSAGIFIVSPMLLDKCSNIITTKWDIVCFAIFEDMYKTSNSKAYEAAFSLKASLRLCISFIEKYKQMTENQFSALYKMFRCTNNALLNKYVFRNVEKPLYLPTAYNFTTKPHTENNLKIAEIILEDRHDKGIAIPPREEVYGNTRISFTYNTREDIFLAEAKKFENYKYSNAPFTPFMTYWPTYTSMNKQQQDWYFYWRNEVRHDNYLQTDLSYIFLYVYELINKIGWTNANRGYSHLSNIWFNYRKEFPKLDNYLVNWIVDFIILNEPDVTIEDFALYISQNNFRIHNDLNVVQKISLMKKATIEEHILDLNDIESISNYRITKSKFYTDSTKIIIESAMKDIVILINKYFIKKTGRSLLKTFEPSMTTVNNYAYASAVYCLEPKQYTIQYVPYTTHEPLKAFIASIIRYVENILRKDLDCVGRLRGVSLESEYSDLIDEFFRRKSNNHKEAVSYINIDLEKVKVLEQESKEVLEMLAVQQNDDKQKEEPATDSNFVNDANVLEKQEKGLLTELENITALFDALTLDQIKLIKFIYDNNAECHEAALNQKFDNIFVYTEIDSINISSQKAVGNFLILHEEEQVILETEYLDELEYIFANKDYLERQINVTEASNGLEWLMNLSKVHKEMLIAILTGKDENFIFELSNKYYSMPEILIDELNALADDNIGDFLIDTTVFPLAICEEYESIVKQIFMESDIKCQM